MPIFVQFFVRVAKISVFALVISEVNGQMFNIFLHGVVASVLLVMRAFSWRYCNSLWNESKKRV